MIRTRKSTQAPKRNALAVYRPPSSVVAFRAAQDGIEALEQSEADLLLAIKQAERRATIDEIVARATCAQQLELARAKRANENAARLQALVEQCGEE